MDKLKDILPTVFSQLKNPEIAKRQKLTLEWPSIVGKEWSGKTRPRLSEDGKLVIWVEQSALAFEIQQKYCRSILKRAQAVLGEKEVTDVRVRVGQFR